MVFVEVEKLASLREESKKNHDSSENFNPFIHAEHSQHYLDMLDTQERGKSAHFPKYPKRTIYDENSQEEEMKANKLSLQHTENVRQLIILCAFASSSNTHKKK